MKTKWNTLLLASAALALLMAVTSRVSADDRPMAPTASSPFRATNPLTLDEPGGRPASAERCAADTENADGSDWLASDGDVNRPASLEGCDCRRPACNPYCMVGAATSYGGDHFEIGFDAAP